MLTLLRESVGTWVAKVFILLLVASFGVWGVSGAIIGGATDSVIKVGKTNVSANDYILAYERSRFGLSRQIGRLLTREEVRAFGIDANVMSQLVSGAVLDESARNMGLGLSDKNLASLIGDDKAFQDANGNFDRRVLVQQLRQLGMSEADYVENRQAVAIRNQLLEGVSANTTLPQAYIDAYDAYRSEKRVFEYVTLIADFLDQQPTPNGQNAKAFYEANKSDYTAPEYRKIIVVKLETEDISKPELVTREKVTQDYEAQKSSFITKEKRNIQQLTLNDEAQGKSIIKRVGDGETFEAILAELGISETDIDIGEFDIDNLPDVNVGKAAFALELNQLSGIVDGVFGPVLLRVTHITPESIKPLSEVEAEIRARLASAKASEELFDVHDRLEDERAAGDSLSEAAAKVKLSTRILEKVDASGRDQHGKPVDELPQLAKLLSEAFKTAEGVEADPISIGNAGYIWYEVKEVFQERQKKLEEVRQDVESHWLETEIAAGIKRLAEQLQSSLNSGEEFTTALTNILPQGATEALKQRKVEKSAEMLRDDTSSDLTTGAVRAGFSIAKDKVVLGPGNNKGEQVVLKVIDVIKGEGNSVGPEEKKRLDEAVADDLLNQLIGDLQQKEPVTVNQNAIVAAQNMIR